MIEARSGTNPVCKALLPIACERRDGATERDLAQGMVVEVGHEQVVVAVHCHAVGALEAGLTPLAVFEASLSPVPCQERTHAAFGDHKQGSLRAPKADAVGSYGCAAHDGTKRAQVEPKREMLGCSRWLPGNAQHISALPCSFSLLSHKCFVFNPRRASVNYRVFFKKFVNISWQFTAKFTINLVPAFPVHCSAVLRSSLGLGQHDLRVVWEAA